MTCHALERVRVEWLRVGLFLAVVLAFSSVETDGLDAQSTEGDGFIDPSGIVVDQDGNQLEEVDIAILVAPSVDGPFERVSNGSVLLSPDTRQNPLVSLDGSFSWAVLPGIYKVQASKPRCVSAEDPTERFAETEPLVVPPGHQGLVLTLDCSVPTTATMPIDIAILDGPPPEGEIIFAVTCEDEEGLVQDFGSHSLDLRVGNVKIPDLPVGDTCFYVFDEVPDGLLLEQGEFLTSRIHEFANGLQFFVGTGATPDELTVSIQDSSQAPSGLDSVDFAVSCDDGFEASQRIEVEDAFTFTPIATGAECTITATEVDGVSIDDPVRRTRVANFGVEGEGEFEWGDQEFFVSATQPSNPQPTTPETTTTEANEESANDEAPPEALSNTDVPDSGEPSTRSPILIVLAVAAVAVVGFAAWRLQTSRSS